MVVAVRHLTLVVPDAALGSLPARVAPAAALLVLPVVAAEDGAGALRAVRPRVAWVALTGGEDAGAVT